MESRLPIGIDLGTTYCCVAVQRRGDKYPEIITNDIGRNTTPSYVAYDEEYDVIVGDTAKDMAHEYPENTVFDVKRLIGRSYYDEHVQRYMKLWPFHLVNYKGLVAVKIGEKTLLPQEIAKELITHLLKTAQDRLGYEIQSAVITVPAYFNSLQRELTREACAGAGLVNVKFISEPTAASLAYGLHSSKRFSGTKTCLIFDLGGGTFDLALMKLRPKQQVEIIAIGGDARLGGEDFNDLLTEYCIQEFNKKEGINLAHGKTSVDAKVRFKTARTLRRIRKECERQKCFLSQSRRVVVSLDGIEGEKILAVPVKDVVFEDLIGDHLNKCFRILDSILRDNKTTKAEVDDVVLIGGSTRIPKVQEMVKDYFPGKRIHRTVDQDEAVACGAAIHAFNLFADKGKAAAKGNFATVLELRENIGSYASVFEHELQPDDLLKKPEKSSEAKSPGAADGGEAKSSAGVVAVALNEYRAMESSEISLNPGSVITNIVKVDECWWIGECMGRKGRFPSNYVAEIKEYKPYINIPVNVPERVKKQEPLPETSRNSRYQPPKPQRNQFWQKEAEVANALRNQSPAFLLRKTKSVFAKQGYRAMNKNEISFDCGDLITNIENIDDAYCQGKCKGKVGFFPATFAK